MSVVENNQPLSVVRGTKKRPQKLPYLDRNSYDGAAKAILEVLLTTNGEPHVVLRGENAYMWNGTHFEHVNGGSLKRTIWRALAGAHVQVEAEVELADGVKTTRIVKPYNPNINHVANVHQAVLTHCPELAYARAPHWIGNASNLPPANEMFPVANGIVHVRTGKLYPPTPKFFCLWASPIEYDPDADCPLWDQFQRSVYEGRRDNIELTEEWFGYCMIGYDGAQKMLVRQGRPGGGKGIEWRILERILGPRALVSMAMSQLGGDDKHATAYLQDKAVLVMPDAAIERGAETKRMVAVLKQLSGGDGMTVRGMGRASTEDKSYAKPYVCTNKALQLPDEAMRRRVLLQKSDMEFAPAPGKPAHPDYDPHLEDKLAEELPGIMNRCIQGIARMLDRGGFVQPVYGSSMLETMLDRMDDISVFLRRHCTMDPGARTPMRDLVDAYNYLYKPAEGLNYMIKPPVLRDRIQELYSEGTIAIKRDTRAKSIMGDSAQGYVVEGLSLTDDAVDQLIPLIEHRYRKRNADAFVKESLADVRE